MNIKERKDHLTFVDSIGNGKIFFKTGSNYSGQNYLHGVIEDVSYSDNSSEKDSIKKIIRQVTITQPVYVKDTI